MKQKYKFISAGFASVTLLAGVIGGVALFCNNAEARPKPPWIAMEPNISYAQSRMAGSVKEALRLSRKQYPVLKHPNKVKWGGFRRLLQKAGRAKMKKNGFYATAQRVAQQTNATMRNGDVTA